MRIDAFSHLLPKRFAEEAFKLYPSQQLKEIMEYTTNMGDIEQRLLHLDQHKIDKQVLTLARPTIWLNMPKDVLGDLMRLGNDTLAEAAAQYPDRFIPIGTLPYPSEEFLPEFDRFINELGMVGIQIWSNIDGKYLDDPEFRPFFAKANATKTPIWIHPQLRPEWSTEFMLDKVLGWPYDATVAMCRLAFAGVMEQFPDLRIITHYMGAMVPFFSERIKGFYEASDMYPGTNVVKLPLDILEYLKRFYNDTSLYGSVHGFECGHTFFGAEHVVFGTDYPMGPEHGSVWMGGAVKQIEDSKISSADKELTSRRIS